MLETAPPDRHGELRKVMQDAFRGPVLAKLERKVRELFDRFLADHVDGEVVDFAETFAHTAAASTMTELLGVTKGEGLRLDPLLRAAAEIGVGVPSGSGDERKVTELWLLRELTRIVRAHRREKRSSGLLGRLLAARILQEPLTDHDVALNSLNVVVAGMGASKHAFAGAAAVWAQFPAALEKVAQDSDLAPGLIDETLRWLTPVIHLTRILTQDVEVAGQELPQGAGVCLWNISANRDEAVFDQAQTFRPDRPPRRHLAFGTGPQHCLGAPIVRMQLGALLSGMVEHGVRFEVDGPPRWIHSNTIAGVERLPVRIHRRYP